jgi:hypothetical protein
MQTPLDHCCVYHLNTASSSNTSFGHFSICLFDTLLLSLPTSNFKANAFIVAFVFYCVTQCFGQYQILQQFFFPETPF